MLQYVLPVFIACFIQTSFVTAQLTAGSVPSGMSAVDPNINLSVAIVAQDTSLAFDIDCDGANDMRVELYKGHVAVDGVSSASLYLTSDSFVICADTLTTSYPPVVYYNMTDLINPFANQWRTDTLFVLGCYGGFICPGPFSANNLYVAYRKTLSNSSYQVGWIKVTFDLNDQGVTTYPITLSIPEILSFCAPTAIHKMPQSALRLYPNPSNGRVQLHGGEGIKQVEIINQAGETVDIIKGNPGVISLPQQTGTYIVRAVGDNDFYWEDKIVRQW